MTDIKVTIDNSLDDVRIFVLEDVLENVTAIEQAGEAAIESAEDAEAWAIGERNGVPVSADDETYQNNSKYYAESASVMANKFFVTDSASGAVASFSDGADDVPMDSVLCYINPSQSGSGDPSPTNVRPISGYSEIGLVHSAKNLLPYPYKDTSPKTNNGVTYTVNEDGSVTAVGTATSTSQFYLAQTLTLPNGSYILTGDMDSDTGSGHKTSILFNENTSSGLSHWNEGLNIPCEFTVSDYTLYGVRIRVNAGETVNQTFYPMIRLASDTDDTYEPYNGTTTTIQLGQTVYGGTLDVVSGVLTVDRAIVDLGSLSWNRYSFSGTYAFYAVKADKKSGVGECEIYAYSESTIPNLADGEFNTKENATYIYIRDDQYSDATSFKTAMNGVTLCYELATPITVQLSPHEVDSLLGTNNIWHNANGNINVIYKADTKLYIDKRLAELS